MSQTYFPVCAKFVPRLCVRPRFVAHLPKPGLFVRTSRGSSSSSARSKTASRATVDDLRVVAVTEADSLSDLLGISESRTTSEIRSDPTSRALYDRDMSIGGRKPFCYIQVQNSMAECELRWESQINELQRSTEKDLRHESMSWELKFAGEDDHSIRQCRE
ncbi:hypothetical protein NL676_002315 [Syzygium grande]|nr:hypothetical protein NL676_002315 [Syzygium grande]